jgi:hypothetical protein
MRGIGEVRIFEAERQGFHMILSMMKYRGFGGETGFWDECIETFTLMSALQGLVAHTSRRTWCVYEHPNDLRVSWQGC